MGFVWSWRGINYVGRPGSEFRDGWLVGSFVRLLSQSLPRLFPCGPVTAVCSFRIIPRTAESSSEILIFKPVRCPPIYGYPLCNTGVSFRSNFEYVLLYIHTTRVLLAPLVFSSTLSLRAAFAFFCRKPPACLSWPSLFAIQAGARALCCDAAISCTAVVLLGPGKLAGTTTHLQQRCIPVETTAVVYYEWRDQVLLDLSE